MTREQYFRITNTTRQLLAFLPGKERLLNLPTYICAVVYLAVLAWLFFLGDPRFIRAALVPAACFTVVTIVRPVIHRKRPYDRFGIPPVGEWEPGKGKSMPSRHAVSAVAIAIAVAYVFPHPAVFVLMGMLTLLVASVRVLSGQHYPSDVVMAVILAGLISWIGYRI